MASKSSTFRDDPNNDDVYNYGMKTIKFCCIINSNKIKVSCAIIQLASLHKF